MIKPSEIFDRLPNIVFLVDDAYRVQFVSAQLVSLKGTAAEKLAGSICYQSIVGRTEPCVNCPIHNDDAAGGVTHDLISSGGERRFYSASFGRDEKGLLIESLSDITDMYQQNNAYRHSIKELKARQVESVLNSRVIKSDYHFLMNIVNSLGYGLMVADADYKILVINRTLSELAKNIFNGEEVKHCYHIYGNLSPCKDCPFTHKRVTKSMRAMGEKNLTVLFETYGGYIVENVRDITREVQLINEIRKSQEENQEKQRQMELLNKDLLRMNDQLKVAQALINDELKQVGALQQSLLPEHLPEIAGYEFGAFYTPAEHAGGDYYDCIEMSNGYWGFAIADVSGHGTPAAVIMAMARAIMRSYTYDVNSSAEALAMVNEILCDNVHTRDFVTMFYAVLDSAEGRLNYASAGHNPVLHFDRSEMVVRKLTADGMFLAAFAHMEYEEKNITLESGDILFMYTDGLVEAMNLKREQYGLDRVISRLIMYHNASCDTLIAEIMEDVKGFTASQPFDDDITILVVKKL